MKVKELIKRLSKENPEHEVVLSRDEEGNGFSSLAGVELFKYLDGEIYSNDDPKLPANCKDAVVLWP